MTYKKCFTTVHKRALARNIKTWRETVKRAPTKKEQATFIERLARKEARQACFDLHPKFPG